MTDLTREDLQHRRDHFTAIGSADRVAYDMALRTHDAEQRAEKAEAENGRLRDALQLMINEKRDYMLRKRLGNPEQEDDIIFARAALINNGA